MSKKLTTAAVVVSLGLALSACSDDTSSESSDSSTSSGSESVKVALVNGVLTGDESACAFSGAKHTLDEAGDDWFESTSSYNVEDEIANVNAAISQGADMIFIWSASPQSAASAVRAAKAADVPIYLFWNSANNVQGDILGGSYYDFRGAGAAAGEWIVDNVPDAKVIELTGTQGTGVAEETSQGLDDALSGSGAELVARQDAEWSSDKAADLASTLLTSNPDVDVFVLPNDAMALSVLRVIDSAGKADQIKVISSSVSNEDGRAAVADGSIPFAAYDPLAQYGADAMTNALDLLAGTTDKDDSSFGPSHVDSSDPDALSFCYDEYMS